MNVSIYDVAKKAGVSVVTVSRVINDVPTVKQSSREKVMNAMKELDYHPNAAARSLARGRSNVIGVIVPSLTDSFITDVIDTIDRELERRGYVMALSVITRNDKDSESRSAFLFKQDKVEGIIVLTPQYEEEYIVALKKHKLPFVIIDNQQYPFTVPSVVVDNHEGGYAVARHLIELGHRKIAHIGGPMDILSAVRRAEGFIQALEEVGLAPFEVARDEFDINTGYSVVERWIKQGTLPTAIFAADDLIAFGAMNALNIHGIKVPEQVSVAGFDNHPHGSKLRPFLTTVQQPSEELGVKGVETLFRIMSGEVKRSLVIKLQPELIVRDSTTECKLEVTEK